MVTRTTTSPDVHATEPATEMLCGDRIHDSASDWVIALDLFADRSVPRARLVHAASQQEHVWIVGKQRNGPVDVSARCPLDDSREHVHHFRFGARIGLHVEDSRDDFPVERKWGRIGDEHGRASRGRLGQRPIRSGSVNYPR